MFYITTSSLSQQIDQGSQLFANENRTRLYPYEQAFTRADIECVKAVLCSTHGSHCVGDEG